MKQERSQVTRDRLMRAAGEVFARAGYEAATLAEIAKRAGVTTGALYFTFEGKEDLAACLIEREAEIAYAAAQDALSRPGEALESMVRLSLDWANLIMTDPVVAAGVRLILECPDLLKEISMPYTHWVSTTEELLRRAQANGELSIPIDTSNIAFIFTSAFVGVDLLSGAVNAREQFITRLHVMWRILLFGVTDQTKAPRAVNLLATVAGST